VFGPPPKPAQRDYSEIDAGIEQPQIIWRLLAPSYATQKNDEAYAYEVLAEALDGGEVGPLFKKLVREQGIASGIETNYEPDARGEAIFTLAVSPAPGKNARRVERSLRHAVRDFAQKGLDVNTVTLAKRRMQRSAIFAREGLMMPGYVFGMALTTGHSVADVEAWPDRINAVTVDQVNAALRDLAATPHGIMGALLPDPHATAAAREAAQPLPTRGAGIR
jgi:zinc protease